MSDFNIDYIEEPNLLFNKGESLNPCIGLIKYGPRFGNKKDIFKDFKVGLIGTSKSISLTKDLFLSFKRKIMPKGDVKPWKIPFPGLNDNSRLKFNFMFNPEWESQITSFDLDNIKKAKESSKTALQLIKNKLNLIYEKETPPNIIIIALPEEFYDICECSKAEKPLIKIGLDDFHNRIKISAMQLKIPTQLIRPETIEFKGTQERCFVAWNLSVGLLYKCQKGHPWKLTHLEENTCYVGISFFKEKGSETRRASIAQIFIDSGESFVLRGDSFKWDNPKYPNSPHLTKENSEKLIKYVIDHYTQIRKKNPTRLVIHKSSNFWDDELEGFKEGTQKIKERDFISINNSDIKLFTQSKYPILRGSLFYLDDDSVSYLFTTGFVPSLHTYPGFSIPRPLQIKPFLRTSPMKKICQEILAFTKLDWNNTFVYSKLPVTISVSRKVGNVMSETEAQKSEYLDSHYYFYM